MSLLALACAKFPDSKSNPRNFLALHAKIPSKLKGTVVALSSTGDLCSGGRKTLKTISSVALGGGVKTEKMPGHWVLARLGKRVLRPGGMQLTRCMLETLRIRHADDVVEFAPGLGITARLTLGLEPASYTAVERDEDAAQIVASYLEGDRQHCVVGNAAHTGLPNQCATVVYGEAMLTMQPEEIKRQIVREAYRLLIRAGRYGIHEMCLMSNNLDETKKRETEKALTGVVHHGVRPLSVLEWETLLESEGFEVQSRTTAPMSLLEPGRLIRDEGLAGAARFGKNLLLDSEARRRVLEMRSVFRRYRKQLGGVVIIARKR